MFTFHIYFDLKASHVINGSLYVRAENAATAIVRFEEIFHTTAKIVITSVELVKS